MRTCVNSDIDHIDVNVNSINMFYMQMLVFCNNVQCSC